MQPDRERRGRSANSLRNFKDDQLLDSTLLMNSFQPLASTQVSHLEPESAIEPPLRAAETVKNPAETAAKYDTLETAHFHHLNSMLH